LEIILENVGWSWKTLDRVGKRWMELENHWKLEVKLENCVKIAHFFAKNCSKIEKKLTYFSLNKTKN